MGIKRRSKDPLSPATLSDHVRELRIRLFVTILLLVAAGIVAYIFYEDILNVLRAPLDAPLYYSNPAGSFAFIMKVCALAGIAAAIPAIIFNLVMFIRPAFKEVLTLRRVIITTILSVALAAAGAVFAYVFIIPGALRFFVGFQVEGLNALISADSYLMFVVNALITFMLVFQIPLLISLIDRIKPIPPKNLFKGEKWALLASLVISLLVPFALDFTVSLLIAAPIFALYNLSILFVLVRHGMVASAAKRATKTQAAKQKATAPPAPAPQKQTLLETLDIDELFPELTSPSTATTVVTTMATTVSQPTHRPIVAMDIVSRRTTTRPTARPLVVPTRPQPITQPVMKTGLGSNQLISDIRI